MIGPQVYDLGLNWPKSLVISKWPSQIKVNSAPLFFKTKTSNLVKKIFHNLLNLGTILIISLEYFTFGFIDFKLPMNDKKNPNWNSCFNGRANYSPKFVPWIAISMMITFQPLYNGILFFIYTISRDEFICIGIFYFYKGAMIKFDNFRFATDAVTGNIMNWMTHTYICNTLFLFHG